MSARDGGPAFPRAGRSAAEPYRDIRALASNGMTLRQWYAGMALVAFKDIYTDDGMPTKSWYNGNIIARRCFAIADAMLAHEQAERERETG